MTRTARHPVRIALPGPDRGAIELVWDLSTLAARRLGERHGIAGDALAAVGVRVEPGFERDQAVVHVEGITRAGQRHPLRPAETLAARWIVGGDLEHVDVEGALRCTRDRPGQARPLYAHTPLLAALGVEPGAYSLRGEPREPGR